MKVHQKWKYLNLGNVTSNKPISYSNTNWQSVLQHWAWLLYINPELNILLVTKFADVFVVDDNDHIWLICTSDATYEKVAHSTDEFESYLANSEMVNRFFMPDLLGMLKDSGLILGDEQCYGFITPNMFKESTIDVDNFKVTNLETYLIGLGVLQERFQKTSPGSMVNSNSVP